jgi:CspA family cold shock protein
MSSGTVKRVVFDKGFGFILGSNGTEWFFHKTAVQNKKWDEVLEGDTVSFEEGHGPKGPRAENVKVL